jgi:formylglycine-generating enzyme required for sulfatase activity
LPAPRSRDVLILPTGAIFDLAGNVGEWSRDWFQGRDSACWRPDGPNLLHDPVCEEPSDSRSFRGGYHSGGAITLLAAERHLNDPVGALNEVGFRCVRPAQPAPP